MSFRFESTVAAIATPVGRGAVALVRVSGPAALETLFRICPGLDGTEPLPRQQRLLAVHHPETRDRVDRALVTYFKAPNSYTGEDTVELSTHGGALTPQLVLDALYAAGAVPAQAGEFTRRAVLNGRLDILQAEAVADLIDGRSPAMHRAAIFQMERGLSRLIEELRAGILHVEALVAYSIDFPEEDEPPVPPAHVEAAARDVVARIDHLLSTAPQGEMLREGALVVLAGRPNSGKSSLFNALLGTERALVTEIPGTTRDAVEASVVIDGYPFRLVDTAGLRHTEDRVEGMGIDVARRYLAAADLVLFCAEAGRTLDPEETEFMRGARAERTILVRTKSDLEPVGPHTPDGARRDLRVSALAASGLADLRTALLAAAFGGILGEPGEAPLVTRGRHARALRAARSELLLFLEALPAAVAPPEVAATHLRAAAGALEDLIGIILPDDVLGAVFGEFCVGK